MADDTLIDADISQIGSQILDPFDISRVQPASYDLAVGGVVIIAYPEAEGGIRSLSLDAISGGGTVEIPPGRAAIVRSLEKLRMPPDMKGRLSLRAYHATKLIIFAGGGIDPGYQGYLFLPIANLSDSPIKLRYGEALVTAEFVKLGKSARPYGAGEEVLTLSSDRVPAVPSRRAYDIIQVSERIDQLTKSLNNLSSKIASLEPMVGVSQTILNVVVLAVGAGVMAGLVVGALSNLKFAVGLWATLAGLGVFVVAAVVYYLVKSRGYWFRFR